MEELRTAPRRLLGGLRAGAVLDLEQSGRVTVESRFMGSAGRPRRINGGADCRLRSNHRCDPLPSRLVLARELATTREDFRRDLRQLMMDEV